MEKTSGGFAVQGLEGVDFVSCVTPLLSSRKVRQQADTDVHIQKWYIIIVLTS